MSDILDTLTDLEDELDEDFSSDELDEVNEENENQMSEARAREITESIRASATVTFVLLAQAHEKGAHKALGYETWAEYVQEEFDMSPQRSYQLLDLGRVVSEIETVTPEGTQVKLTEAQARDIKRELPLVTEKIKAGLDDGETAEDAVDRAVSEVRDQKKADENALAKNKKAADDAEQEGYRTGLESAADAMLDADDNSSKHADDGYLELEVEGDGTSMSPEDSMNLYNFFNVLHGLSTLPEPDDFVRAIPKNRAAEVDEHLLECVSWVNRFQTIWELEQES